MKRKQKLTVENMDLANQEVGFTFQGRFIGESKSEPFEEVDDNGEIKVKQLDFTIFERPGSTDRFKIIADAGFKSAFRDALVKEGDFIEVEKLAKKKLSQGRTMNQYAIYALES